MLLITLSYVVMLGFCCFNRDDIRAADFAPIPHQYPTAGDMQTLPPLVVWRILQKQPYSTHTFLELEISKQAVVTTGWLRCVSSKGWRSCAKLMATCSRSWSSCWSSARRNGTLPVSMPRQLSRYTHTNTHTLSHFLLSSRSPFHITQCNCLALIILGAEGKYCM